MLFATNSSSKNSDLMPRSELLINGKPGLFFGIQRFTILFSAETGVKSGNSTLKFVSIHGHPAARNDHLFAYHECH